MLYHIAQLRLRPSLHKGFLRLCLRDGLSTHLQPQGHFSRLSPKAWHWRDGDTTHCLFTRERARSLVKPRGRSPIDLMIKARCEYQHTG